ncbi:aspartyl-phosphate phosphatase Spo0E family protein [Paenibacillus sp. BR2-3]|uniref:aspartyl-phosphate phosphatase Spo0E family protein n=1 Tax=Paenibacillus sp. BR2-3 TaxID=3048494 RepID=UPI0039774A22
MLVPAFSRDEHRRDYREDELYMTIESLRCELLEVAQQRSLSDRTVVELSERLDRYILLAQTKMMEGLRSRKAAAPAHGTTSKKMNPRNKTALHKTTLNNI